MSDLAFDERRNVLYVANFTANRIEVLSASDNTLQAPMYVPQQPGSIALSPDNRFLVIAHYPASDRILQSRFSTLTAISGKRCG